MISNTSSVTNTTAAASSGSLANAGTDPAAAQDRFLKLLGHNHTSAVAHLGSADEAFGRALLAFCHDVGIAATANVAMPDVATPAGAHGVELQS